MDGRQLVIGMGTGRCGTVSLATLLDAQPAAWVLHEGVLDGAHRMLPWQPDPDALDRWLGTLRARSDGHALFGDVGPYFLPYVELLAEREPEARFVCLKRDRAETVRSFLQKTEGRNHWYDHGGDGWAEDPLWDPAFPSFDEPDKAAALGRYWDAYYAEADRLAARHPDRFRVFPTETLNAAEGRAALLDAAGYTGERVLDLALRENRTPWWKRWRRAR